MPTPPSHTTGWVTGLWPHCLVFWTALGTSGHLAALEPGSVPLHALIDPTCPQTSALLAGLRVRACVRACPSSGPSGYKWDWYTPDFGHLCTACCTYYAHMTRLTARRNISGWQGGLLQSSCAQGGEGWVGLRQLDAVSNIGAATRRRAYTKATLV